MKKVVLVLLLGVFAFGSSGFKADLNYEDDLDCEEFAYEATTSESIVFNKVMSFQEFAEAYTTYYNFCVDLNQAID